MVRLISKKSVLSIYKNKISAMMRVKRVGIKIIVRENVQYLP